MGVKTVDRFRDDHGGVWIFEHHLTDGGAELYVVTPGGERTRLHHITERTEQVHVEGQRDLWGGKA